MKSQISNLVSRPAPALLVVLLHTSVLLKVSADDGARDILRPNDRVVFLGNTFADQLRLNGYVETLLTIRRPDHKLTFRNLGWSGDELTLQPRPLNFGSLDEHLTQQRADVVIACFGMNESFDSLDEVAEFEAAWTQFLRRLRSQKYNSVSPPRLVVVSPIRHEDIHRRLGDFDAHNEKLEAYVAAMRKVAAADGVTFIDLFAFTQKLADEGPSQKVTTNGIHPNAYGYWAISHAVADVLAPGEEPSLTVDALALTATETAACEVKQINRDGDTLFLRVAFDRPTAPPPPDGSIVHPALQQRQPTLRVLNLPAGQYQLSVEGRAITAATADQWKTGMVINGIPSQTQAEQIRASVNRKNEWFFYRWRPSNAEYVFGRRTKPFGSVSFPPELEAFDRLVEQQDGEIHESLRIRTATVLKLKPQ